MLQFINTSTAPTAVGFRLSAFLKTSAVVALTVAVALPPTWAETVRIGISAPLTGIQAPSGQDVVTHLKATVEELNRRGDFGNHRVELNVMDDQYDTERTKSNVLSLIRDKHVHLLINQIGSAHISAALPIIQGSGVTLFAPLSGPANLYADGLRPSVVPLRASYSDEVRQQVRMLAAIGVTSVAIVYQNDSFGLDVIKAWHTHSVESGVKVVAQHPLERGNSEVEPIIDVALQKSPGAIVMALVSTPALRAAKHLRVKSNGLVYAVMMSVAATSEVITALQGTGRGTVLFSSVMPLPTSGSNRLLLDYADLRKKYSLKPSFRGLEAYVAMRIVAEQLRKMQSVTSQSLGLALANAQSFAVSDITMRAREPRFADVFAITRAGVL